MSGVVVIIVSQDPDDLTAPAPDPATDALAAVPATQPGKAVMIPFGDSDSSVEIGHRAALALARLRR